jgi:hypothetical protein
MAVTHAWHDLVHDMRDEVHDIATIGKADVDRQAYLGLWATFIALPLLFGLDKFAGVITDNWEGYLATWANDIIPGSAAAGMIGIGIVEVVLALLVFAAPRIGGDLLALWMLLVAINLWSVGGMAELGIAALAMGVCALAMARLSRKFHHTEG